MRRADLLGLIVGAAIAVFDLGTFHLGGLEIPRLGASWMGRAVLGGFVIGYAGLGFAMGRLVMARARSIADATRIREQLDALEESRQRLLASEKLAALGRLAAGIAHEVRNPLGVIRASASLVEEGLVDGSEDRRACELIVEETDRLDGLIGALLSFARPAKMVVGEARLVPIVERAVELATKAEARRSLVVDVDVPDIRVRADQDLLTQLVLGLLVNAAEAGASRVRVDVTVADETYEVRVADDGSGVSEEAAGQIFEPFFTTKASGTGLGLAMASRIVEAHGGSLELRSRSPGATFALSLPRSGPRVRTEAA